MYPNGLVEAVFDREYLGGKDLYGRCKKGTGNIVPPFCLVNKTRPADASRAKQQQQQQRARKDAAPQRAPKAGQQPPKQQDRRRGGGGKEGGPAEGAAAGMAKLSVKEEKPEDKQAKLANAGAELLKMLQKK